jgi:predicted small secreted protein
VAIGGGLLMTMVSLASFQDRNVSLPRCTVQREVLHAMVPHRQCQGALQRKHDRRTTRWGVRRWWGGEERLPLTPDWESLGEASPAPLSMDRESEIFLKVNLSLTECSLLTLGCQTMAGAGERRDAKWGGTGIHRVPIHATEPPSLRVLRFGACRALLLGLGIAGHGTGPPAMLSPAARNLGGGGGKKDHCVEPAEAVHVSNFLIARIAPQAEPLLTTP